MDLKGLLSGVATIGAILCTFAAVVLFAMGKLSDTQGARGEAMMIGCAIAAVAFAAAATYINSQNLVISS
jgi:MFS family permease